MTLVTLDPVRVLHAEGGFPTSVLRYRTVFVTQHVMDPGAVWRWTPQPDERNGTAVIGSATCDLTLRDGEQASRGVPADALLCLHPQRETVLQAASAGVVTCAWVPWDAMKEVESGATSLAAGAPPSDLGCGLQAFLNALLAESSEPSPYSDYLVERLILEMVFGTLVEASPDLVDLDREVSGIGRARSLILIRRADPDFDVAALASDLHVSVRSLQRLFAGRRSTPADELRQARVDLARELMRDPAYDSLTIEDIAAYSGFRDGGGLRRAFTWAGLPSPQAMREASRR